MKDGVLYLAGIGILAGGIYMYQSNMDPFHPLQSLNLISDSTSRAPTPVTPQTPAAEPSNPARKSNSAPVSHKSTALKHEPVESPSAFVATVAPPVLAKAKAAAPPPFPVLDQIEAGSRDAAITAKYGSPAVSTLTSDSGHLIETFIYTRDRGHSATVIHLEDGKVARAYNSGAPVAPVGISAPVRWRNQ